MTTKELQVVIMPSSPLSKLNHRRIGLIRGTDSSFKDKKKIEKFAEY